MDGFLDSLQDVKRQCMATSVGPRHRRFSFREASRLISCDLTTLESCKLYSGEHFLSRQLQRAEEILRGACFLAFLHVHLCTVNSFYYEDSCELVTIFDPTFTWHICVMCYEPLASWTDRNWLDVVDRKIDLCFFRRSSQHFCSTKGTRVLRIMCTLSAFPFRAHVAVDSVGCCLGDLPFKPLARAPPMGGRCDESCPRLALVSRDSLLLWSLVAE